MLAIVCRIDRYHTYLFGQDFTLLTDNKLLESIAKKHLHSVPPRFQTMIMTIQGYGYTIQYRPEKDIVLADKLNRLSTLEGSSEILQDIWRGGIHAMDAEDNDFTNISLINFPLDKQETLGKETTSDPILRSLMDIIHQEWPTTISELPNEFRSYWAVCAELSIECGVICKGRRTLIPKTVQYDVLQQLHEGHQVMEKTRQLARERVFWTNINKYIETRSHLSGTRTS